MCELCEEEKKEYSEVICKQEMIEFMKIFDKFEEMYETISDVLLAAQESYSIFTKCRKIDPDVDEKTGLGWPVAMAHLGSAIRQLMELQRVLSATEDAVSLVHASLEEMAWNKKEMNKKGD